MGSGSGGLYSGTGGGSQPYAEKYGVVQKELAKDKRDPDIYDKKTGYFKNPTATNLNDSIVGEHVEIDGKTPNGPITYVLDTDGNIIIGKRCNPNDSGKRSPHPTLIGGTDPQVQCAGMLNFKNGKIVSVDTNSGHFRPNPQSLPKVEAALDNLYKKHPKLFTKNSKWRKEDE